MSSLNQVELAALMKAAMNPKPVTPNREYKRRSRQIAASMSKDGKLAFNSETMSKALLDAIASAIRTGHPDLTIADIIQAASQRFLVPAVAEVAILARLASRKPAAAAGGHDHE
ncbi:hypothetical protein [Dongia sp.]|uniref:hypothetical protein n=1 Tax=Dongia sp. TaxID=1977262 RepID=UPI0035AD8E11